MKLFIDANILVAVVNKEYPLFSNSSRILSLAGTTAFEVYTSPVCLAIAFYFAEKKSGTQLAKNKLAILSSELEVTTIDKAVILNAATDNRVNDFEDGMQYYAAKAAGCNCIITEDTGDYYFSDIEVLNTRQFFDKYLYRRYY